MRCPDCNKFVAYGDQQCEVQSVEAHDGALNVSVRVVLTCGDCGQELKDADMDSSADIEHACNPDGKPDEDWKEGEDQFIIENDGDAEPTDRMQTTDRHGKPIKNHRYMKHFYGFELDSEIHCCKCGEDFTVSTSSEEQASGFNELV